jgi:NADH:ubiquinone reductase (non-electrogenic)
LSASSAEPANPEARSGEATPAPVIVVGGGFGGLYTALELASRRPHPPILLIEPNERFLFLPLLYELLSGELNVWEVAPRYDDLLASSGVAWLQDRVLNVDALSNRLNTAGGRTISYSRAVIATGGQSNRFGIPGADTHTLGFRSLEDVERLRKLVDDLKRQRRPLQRLAVVGAGATGVELACKLADLVGDSAVIELIEQGPDLLPASRAFSREQALHALQRRDVRLRTRTTVREVNPDSLRLQCPDLETAGDREEILAVNGVIWTAGLSFQPPAIEPAADRDRQGRLLCDDSLRLQGQPRIFAVGDVAALPQEGSEATTAGQYVGALPTTAQVAFQQAPVLAANLKRSLASEPLLPFAWKDLGEMLSLGRGDASIASPALTLAGPAAYRLRRLAYLSRLPGLGHQVRVAAGWLADLRW